MKALVDPEYTRLVAVRILEAQGLVHIRCICRSTADGSHYAVRVVGCLILIECVLGNIIMQCLISRPLSQMTIDLGFSGCASASKCTYVAFCLMSSTSQTETLLTHLWKLRDIVSRVSVNSLTIVRPHTAHWHMHSSDFVFRAAYSIIQMNNL